MRDAVGVPGLLLFVRVASSDVDEETLSSVELVFEGVRFVHVCVLSAVTEIMDRVREADASVTVRSFVSVLLHVRDDGAEKVANEEVVEKLFDATMEYDWEFRETDTCCDPVELCDAGTDAVGVHDRALQEISWDDERVDERLVVENFSEDDIDVVASTVTVWDAERVGVMVTEYDSGCVSEGLLVGDELLTE